MKLLFGLKSDTFSRKDICRRPFRKFLDEFHLVTGETLPRIEFTRDRATFPFPRWRSAFCCFPKFSSLSVSKSPLVSLSASWPGSQYNEYDKKELKMPSEANDSNLLIWNP